MQFKVPQDVQQADKIVSFMTLPQLIISIVGFGIDYAVYSILNGQGLTMIFWFPPVLFIGLLTIAFAFIKIANLPFHQYLALILERLLTPSKRIWVKGADRITEDITYISAEDKKKEKRKKAESAILEEKEEKLKGITDISEAIDTLGRNRKNTTTEAIDKKEDKELPQAFLETGKKEEKPETIDKVKEKIMAISQKPPTEKETRPKSNDIPEVPAWLMQTEEPVGSKPDDKSRSTHKSKQNTTSAVKPKTATKLAQGSKLGTKMEPAQASKPKTKTEPAAESPSKTLEALPDNKTGTKISGNITTPNEQNANKEGSFSNEELKEGQTITFPPKPLP